MDFTINTECLLCHLRRCMELTSGLKDEKTQTAFTQELMQLLGNAPKDMTSPFLDLDIRKLLQKHYGLNDDIYQADKDASNRFVLEQLENIRKRIDGAKEPLFAALQFTILGNYIDFSALQGQVSFSELEKLLDEALQMELDKLCFENFLQELKAGKHLLYITDNAGEICFDRLFAETLHKHLPHLEITFCVRGGLSKNDATREDAEIAGIPFPIVDNGTTICGTDLNALPPAAKAAFENADVILAKGQGNTETLCGCGLNIYYAFLCKCQRFIDDFKKPRLTPMFVREKDLNP